MQIGATDVSLFHTESNFKDFELSHVYLAVLKTPDDAYIIVRETS